MNAVKRKAEKIVSELENQFPTIVACSHCEWDHDEAREIVAMYIPLSDALAEEEFEEAMKAPPAKPGPAATAIGRLRTLLHAEGLSITCTLNAAAEKLEQAVEAWLRAEEVSRIPYDSAERTDWYWWWDEDGLPLPVYVAYSPTSESYFATQGQLGWNRSQEILDMGGWWMPLREPSLPESE